MAPEEVVRGVFQAFAARDEKALVALFDADAEFYPQGTAESVGRGEPYRGHAGISQYLKDVDATWQRLELHPGALRTAAGGVVAFGEFEGVRSDGTPAAGTVIWTFKVRDGKVVSGRAGYGGWRL